jgi:hypothetical protein
MPSAAFQGAGYLFTTAYFLKDCAIFPSFHIDKG